MKILSLFSGVGGFDMGLEAAGMTTVGLCEIDKNCRRVLRRHWPDVPIYDDVTTLTAEQLLADGVYPDVVAWGSPCQDLSVAGKRTGLEGGRSGLFYEGIRIIKELRKATNNEYPTWSIWENVPGALNSNSGRDFAAVLDEMGDAGALVVEWGVLDAQNFGVPQRRRRVFLVACFDPATSSRCPDPLLPLGEGSPRDFAASRATRKAVADAVEGGVGGGGVLGSDRVGALAARDYKGVGSKYVAENKLVVDGNTPTTGIGYTDDNGVLRGSVTSKWHKGSGGPVGDEAYNLVTETFVKAKRAQSSTDDDRWEQTDTAPTLNSFDVGDTRTVTAIVNTDLAVRRLTPLECERLMGWPEYEKTATISVCNDPVNSRVNAEIKSLKKRLFVGNVEKTESTRIVSFAKNDLSQNNRSDNSVVDFNVLLNFVDGHIAITDSSFVSPKIVNIAELNFHYVRPGKHEGFAQLCAAISGLQEKMLTIGKEGKPTSEIHSIQRKNGLQSNQLFGDAIKELVENAVTATLEINLLSMFTTSAVGQSFQNFDSRLTILCCYVLDVIGSYIPEKTLTSNSFNFSVTVKDSHTAIGENGPISDSNRYKMCGNGVASPCAEWIGKQILNV